MQHSVVIDTIGIGLQHGAHVGRQIGFVARIDRIPHAEEIHQIVGGRRTAALGACERAPHRQHHVLHGAEIVLCVRVCEAVSHVHIARATDVWHTEFIALDACVVGLGDIEKGLAIGLGR